VILTRHYDDGLLTRGVLQLQGLTLQTIERPWIPNPEGPGGLPKKSCVPVGTYTLEHHNGTDFKDVWALVNHELGVYHWTKPEGQTWGRTAILIHAGNYVENVIGCIAPGMTGGDTYVSESRDAVQLIRSILDRRQKHTLVIQ
jgi:hypothetical protein